MNGAKRTRRREHEPAGTVSDAIVQRLSSWGIRRVYGFPGDGINGVLGALQRAARRIEFIQVAHEELAGMAACAHAKFTGDLGVCLSTGGPGLIHMLNGMYDHEAPAAGMYPVEVPLMRSMWLAKASNLQHRSTSDEREQYRNDQRDAILRAFGEYQPAAMIVFHVDFGHTEPQHVIPVGGTVTVDGENQRISVTY